MNEQKNKETPLHCTFVHIQTERENTLKQDSNWATTCIYGNTPPISISLSRLNDVEDKNGSWASEDNGSIWFVLVFPLVFTLSILSSSTIPNTDSESSGGKVSNVAKMGVEGGTKGLVWLFNDEDNDDGSCLIIVGLFTAIFGVAFVGELIEIPFNKHFFSNS